MKPVSIEEIPRNYVRYSNQINDFVASEYRCAELENVVNSTSAYSAVWQYIHRKN